MVHSLGGSTVEWLAAGIGENGAASTVELTATAKAAAHGERRNNAPFYRRGGMAANGHGRRSGYSGCGASCYGRRFALNGFV
jgi:hypothetical protein